MNVQIKTNEEFNRQLYERFKGKIVSLSEYHGRTEPMTFWCSEHNLKWKATPTTILKGKGCPKCCTSKNEIKISNILDKHGILYVSQKRFDDCADIRTLPFDFYLPDYNMCIEYDGEGHYLESFYSSRTSDPEKMLDRVIYHDDIKTKYCNDHKIHLLRIPYWKQDDIEKILENELQKYNIKQLAC